LPIETIISGINVGLQVIEYSDSDSRVKPLMASISYLIPEGLNLIRRRMWDSGFFWIEIGPT